MSVSKGKRDKKRKRQEAGRNRQQQQSCGEETPIQESPSKDQTPPSITKYVTIGLNAITKELEEDATSSQDSVGHNTDAIPSSQTSKIPYAIFLTHPPSSLQYSHLPRLIGQVRSGPQPKVVTLAGSAERQLCQTLALPRISLVALRKNAPGSEALNVLLARVDEITVPSLAEMSSCEWLGTNIVVYQAGADMCG